MKRDLTRSQAEARVRKLVSPRFAKRILSTLRPAIGFQDGRFAAEPVAKGTTRFAGRPDLPADIDWPAGPDGPLAFIGQIALKEVHPFDADRRLPRAGVLWFFYNIHEYASGNDPADRAKFRVIFRENPGPLARREFPKGLPQAHRLERALRVRAYTRWQAGDQDALERERLGLGEDDRPNTIVSKGHPLVDALGDVNHVFSKPFIPVGTHQMLGWPKCYGDPPYRLRCAATLLGRGGWDDVVNAEAMRWLPLLAVGDNRDLYHDTWADGGTVIYLIRDEQLAAGKFDECWCTLLST